MRKETMIFGIYPILFIIALFFQYSPQSENLLLFCMFISSVCFIGFSVSMLGILILLGRNEALQRVKETDVMFEKMDRYITAIKYLAVSMVFSFSQILVYFGSIGKFVLCLTIALFLTGLWYFLVGIADLRDVLKILYCRNKEEYFFEGMIRDDE